MTWIQIYRRKVLVFFIFFRQIPAWAMAWAHSSPNDVFPLSFKTMLLQVALGRYSLYRFHSNALWQISFWLFRRACPIQPNLLLLISTFMSDFSVLSHSSWFVIISGHHILSAGRCCWFEWYSIELSFFCRVQFLNNFYTQRKKCDYFRLQNTTKCFYFWTLVQLKQFHNISYFIRDTRSRP
jgi:hypothetical protein